MRKGIVWVVALFLGLLSQLAIGTAKLGPNCSAQTEPRSGIEEREIGVHALTGATIIPTPGTQIENGTILIRRGVIEAVGKQIPIPQEARVWDLSGHTITAGWIDLDLRLEPKLPTEGESREGRAWNDRVHPEIDISEGLQIDGDRAKSHRESGFAIALATPSKGILAGQGSLVRLTGRDDRRTVLAHRMMQIASLEHGGWGDGGYPGSRMGAIALLRQSLLDAQWYQEAWQQYQASPAEIPRPEVNLALAAMGPVIDGDQPIALRSRDVLDLLSLGKIASEFGLRGFAFGSGEEQLWLQEVVRLAMPMVIPVTYPEAPTVDGPGGDTEIALRTLELWARAPENAIRLDRAGIRFALTPRGLKDVGEFTSAVRSTIERGLPMDRALAAVTSEAAAIVGCTDQYGRISEGANATLTVLDGTPFGEKTKVVEVWIDGERFATTRTIQQDLRGSWELTLHRKQGAVALELEITGSAKKPRLKAQFDGEKLQPAAIHRLGNEVGFTLPASPLRAVGFLRLGGVYGGGDRFEGSARTPDGSSIRFTVVRTGQPSDTASGDSEDVEEGEETSEESESGWSRRGPRREQKSLDPEVWAGSAEEALPTPLGARGRTGLPSAPETIFVTGGTIWTSGPKGILEDADLLIQNGKVIDVGQDLSVPADALVIDATDRHLTPGIIDPHSHTAIIGGVNEGTQAVTAEVRIGDVVNANDINLYRQLAGGLTTAHLMHGSANPIGGQGQVIKLKWGEPPERLKVEGPLLIKCALGENVKQSNWDNPTGRYPQTRMGVEQIFRDAFWAAREYSAKWQRARNSESHLIARPRVDLELEALVEILNGERLIHCHSYRQDEILMLMRVAEDFGFKIGTFQHVLEGYKIANEIAEHGASASSFSDWWAYKFEVYDAIPHNGALLHRAGVLTTFNSDSSELARRMNLEAAKAVKYGGVPRPEALKFVTLNAAIQLDLGEKIGSLEPGKDADFVIWNGDPLSTYTRCDETWIEGRRYFSREEDAQLRQRDTQRRELLISRVLATKHGQAKTPSPDSPDSSSAERGAPRPRADTVEREDRGTIRSRKKSNQDKAVEVSKPDAQSSTLEEKNDSPKGGTR